MCLFGSKNKGGGYTPGVKPIQDTDTPLPTGSPLRQEKDRAEVSYGGGGKRGEATQKSKGARDLMINLPATTQEAAQQGGLNSGQL